MRVRDTGEVVELPEFDRMQSICRDEGSEDYGALVCTLPAGHSGVHVAHGVEGPLAFWLDSDKRLTLVTSLEPSP